MIELPTNWTIERFNKFSDEIQWQLISLSAAMGLYWDTDGFDVEWLINEAEQRSLLIHDSLYRECQELEQFLVCNSTAGPSQVFTFEGETTTNAHDMGLSILRTYYARIKGTYSRNKLTEIDRDIVSIEDLSRIAAIVQRERLICAAAINEKVSPMWSCYLTPTKWRSLFRDCGVEISSRSWSKYKSGMKFQDHPASGVKQVRFLISDLESSGLNLDLLETS